MPEIVGPEKHETERSITNAMELDKKIASAESTEAQTRQSDLSDFRSPEQKAKVKQFEKDFRGVLNVECVAENATGENWAKRAGADHQIDTARELGRAEIAAFEAPFFPLKGSKLNHVDIVTKDNIAIECKTSWGDLASPSTVRSANDQAERRLSDTASYQSKNVNYKDVIVVFKDYALNGDAGQLAKQYQTDKIRYCELHELKQTLQALRSGKGG